MKLLELVTNLLNRMASIKDVVIVRVVRRDKQGNVVFARHAPISYIREIDGDMEALCIEEIYLKEVPLD